MTILLQEFFPFYVICTIYYHRHNNIGAEKKLLIAFAAESCDVCCGVENIME